MQDALDEIQYVIGGTDTHWGTQRAADGHPAPFPLKFVEIGNEDFFDGSGSYDGRFAQFYDAIKAAYPNLQVIAMLVNVNPGASQWPTNLIGYDALYSYGSPSYYVQQMFSRNHGDVVLPATLTETGGSQVFESVTQDSRYGTIFLKVVNTAAAVQPIHITLNGVHGVLPAGRAVVLTSGSPQDTNTLGDPERVVPVTKRADGLGESFDYSFAPNSVTVLQIDVGGEHPEPPDETGDDGG